MAPAVIHFFRDPQNLTPGGFQKPVVHFSVHRVGSGAFWCVWTFFWVPPALRGCAPINLKPLWWVWTPLIGHWTTCPGVIQFFREPQNLTPGSVPKTGGELDRSTWQGQVCIQCWRPSFRLHLALRGCAPIRISGPFGDIGPVRLAVEPWLPR